MSIPWRLMLRDLGALLHLPAALSLPALAVCAAFGEWRVAPGFLVAGVMAVGAGQVLHRFSATGKEHEWPSAPLITVASGWLAFGLLAAVPFLMWGRGSGDAAAIPFASFWTSFFEAMAGITSTGLTMAEDPSLLPHAVQWWRSALQWTGGIGVVVFAIAVMHPAESSRLLFSAEAREERTAPTFRKTARNIWWIFGIYTLGSIGALRLAGMPWWEALNHGMTGIATGGFTVTRDGFAGYGTAVKMVTVAIILLGATSFTVHSAIVSRRDWSVVRKDRALRGLLGMLVAGTLLLLAFVRRYGDHTALADTVFQWASALGTCGFNSIDISGWLPPCLILLSVGMFVGGASGSTTGGIKIGRAILLLEGPLWHLRKRLIPRPGSRGYRVDGKKLRESEAFARYRNAVAMAGLFVGLIVVATLFFLLLLGPETTALHVVFEVTSALGNVGLSTGITGPGLPWVGKLVLILLMWMGRLEILAVLVLVGAPFLARTGE